MNFDLYYGKVSNSGHDENGNYSNGKAGDQTGGEWAIISWYSRPWNYVFRYPDQQVGQKIAEISIQAANNNKIGYDQYQRYTYWEQLKNSGYHPSQITTACESDCSAGVAANIKAVGYLNNIQAFKNISIYSTTRDLRSSLQKAGFKVFTANKFLNGYDYLRPGDILLLQGSHVAVNLGIGKYADYQKPTEDGDKVVPAQNFNKEKAGTYIVEVDDFLNLRSGPGTNYSILTEIKGNQQVKCYGYFTKKGNENWLYVTYKDLQGYCDESYLKNKNQKEDNSSKKKGLNTTPKKEGKVTAEALYVRVWPGKENDTIKTIPVIKKDTIIEICDEINDAEGQKWYYIRINKKVYGFVKASFIKVI